MLLSSNPGVQEPRRLGQLSLLGSVMSNNSAAASGLAIAQKTVKQLRVEAGVRRIKVGLAFQLKMIHSFNQSCHHRVREHHQSIKSTNTHHCAPLINNLFRMYTSLSICYDKLLNVKSFLFQLIFNTCNLGLGLEVIRGACECDLVVKRQQTECFCAHSGSFVDCAAAVWLPGLLEDLLLAQITQTRSFGCVFLP